MSKLESLLCGKAAGNIARPPVREALPIRLDPEGASEAILLFHGFSGYPGELAPLAKGFASAGYAVRVPRLPGHGTCQADFLLSKAEDWARSAYDAYMDLRAEYGIVHMAGHSMGGLLASCLAARFDTPKLILLAPAFELSIKGMSLAPMVAPFKKVLKTHRSMEAIDLEYPERRRLHADYWADVMIGPAAELESLRKLCRKTVKRLKSRTLLIIGDSDTTVSPNVVPFLRGAAPRMASFDSRTIKGGNHVFPFNERSAEMVRIVLDWMGPPGDA